MQKEYFFHGVDERPNTWSIPFSVGLDGSLVRRKNKCLGSFKIHWVKHVSKLETLFICIYTVLWIIQNSTSIEM